jgi:hypothetical protein
LGDLQVILQAAKVKRGPENKIARHPIIDAPCSVGRLAKLDIASHLLEFVPVTGS